MLKFDHWLQLNDNFVCMIDEGSANLRDSRPTVSKKKTWIS